MHNKTLLCLLLALVAFGCGPQDELVETPSLMASKPIATEAPSDIFATGPSPKVADAPAQARPSAQSASPIGQTQAKAGSIPGPQYDQSKQLPKSAGCNSGLRGLTSEFPWGGGKGVWQGTKHPDPEPLKAISNEEMLGMAADASDESDDREHALVSIGRRKLEGAIEIFTAAAQPKERLQVREMALSGLIEHGGAAALPIMWSMLKGDPSAQVRGMAIWAIALYGPSAAEQAIQFGLADAAVSVQGMAILGTWAMKDSPNKVFPILEATAHAEDRIIWQEALYMLGRMPYPRARDILLSLTSSKDLDKKNSAIFYYRRWLKNFPDLCK